MFGDVVMGVEHEFFEHELTAAKEAKGVANDTDLDVDDLKELVERYKKVYSDHLGSDFPQDPMTQLEKATEAVFKKLEHRPRDQIPPAERHQPACTARPSTARRWCSATWRRLRDGRRVHARPEHGRERDVRRVPDQRPGRGRGGGHPHAQEVRRDEEGSARELPGDHEGAADARGALPRHPGLRVHRRAGHAVHAPDAQRQARRQGGAEVRARRAEGGQGRRGRRGQARQPRAPRPTAAPDARPGGGHRREEPDQGA